MERGASVRIWAISLNTFREAARDRVLHGLVAFAALVLAFTLAIAELSLDQQARVVHDLGLATISLFSVIAAVFLGSSLLYKEIERKTLYVILPKPISRHEFVLGKYFGIVMTGSVFVAIAGSLHLWISALQTGAAPLWLIAGGPLVLALALAVGLLRARDRTSVIIPWCALALGLCSAIAASAGVTIAPILAAFVLNVGEVSVLAAVAMFFSSFSTPFLTGGLTFGVWLVGRAADEMATMRSSSLPVAIRSTLHAIAWAVPNFNLFVPPRDALVGSSSEAGGPVAYLTTTIGYGALYTALLLTAACLVFRRRSFQ